MFRLKNPTFRCVITYRYDDRIVEIPSNPTSLVQALWLLRENGHLNAGSEHVLSARVFTEQDYRRHLMQRTAEFGLVAL